MRVTHGNWDAGKLSIGELDGELVPYLRLAHGTAKLKVVAVALGQGTSLQAGARTNDARTAIVLGAVPCRNAARAIARNLRLGAVSIQQPHPQVRIGGWEHPFHTVGANAIMPIADMPAERINIAGHVGKVDDQKIVAAGCRLNERNTRPSREFLIGVHDPMRGL